MIAAVLALLAVAAADPLSPYERATIEAAVESRGAEIDPAPAGKLVEGIDTVT
ncbi:MAG: hypothetical protein JST92_24725, partial [Deltaproteobacteria bacterium]|nr:hypothetical protein [Deltaproteobacteria bacterium]